MTRSLRQWALAIAVSLAVTALSAGAPADAKPQQVPATRITLDVPDGYQASKQFPGFINETTGASIVVVEMPAAAFADFKKADFAAKLAANGFANVQPGALPFKGEHIYITAEQATVGGAFSKYLLIFGDENTTAMLTVSVLKADITSGKTKTAGIEAMLATAALVTAKAEPQPAAFSLSYSGPLKAAGAMGNAQLYTRDGKLAPDRPDPGRAVFVVAPSIDKTVVTDVALASKTTLATLFDIDAGKIVREGPISISGLTGHEIEIEAPHKASGGKSSAYQVILLTKDGGYVRMVGTANAAEAVELMPEFRKMAASFKPAPEK